MPKRPCLDCGAVSDGSRCLACARRRERRRVRPGYRVAYSDPVYRRARVRLRGQPCWYCGQPSDTVDHLVPLARGGDNAETNLVPACRRCNLAKAAKPAPGGR